MAPLIQIICKLRFDELEHELMDKKNGELYEFLKEKYPLFRTEQDKDINVKVAEDGKISHEIRDQKPRLIYYNENTKRFISISRDNFTFIYNIDNNYSSWDKNFKPELKFAWEKFKELLNITTLKSIGVRYINHIKLDNSVPRDILKENEYLPSITIKKNLNFFNRVEIEENDKTFLITTGTLKKKSGDEENDIILLDIDVVKTKDINIEELDSNLEESHTTIAEIFKSSIK